MNESTLTLKFKGIEAELLDKMVKSGLFNTKSEAIRAALVKYSMDVGIFDRQTIWQQIKVDYHKRNISAKKLAKDLDKLEDEV